MLFGQKHVERYRGDRRGGGARLAGHDDPAAHHHGTPVGETRTTPLIYQRFGDDYLVVASNGGSDGHPAWYLNLRADPNPEVQVKADRFAARARTATADEARHRRTMTAAWAPYDDYQQKTDREIPVVVLERAEDD